MKVINGGVEQGKGEARLYSFCTCHFGSEVLTAVTVKSSVFKDVICNPVKIDYCFGGTCFLHL
jgi:hypothetical protein